MFRISRSPATCGGRVAHCAINSFHRIDRVHTGAARTSCRSTRLHTPSIATVTSPFDKRHPRQTLHHRGLESTFAHRIRRRTAAASSAARTSSHPTLHQQPPRSEPACPLPSPAMPASRRHTALAGRPRLGRPRTYMRAEPPRPVQQKPAFPAGPPASNHTRPAQGYITRSTPSPAARSANSRIFRVFPAKSPTVGLICASAIFTLSV